MSHRSSVRGEQHADRRQHEQGADGQASVARPTSVNRLVLAPAIDIGTDTEADTRQPVTLFGENRIQRQYQQHSHADVEGANSRRTIQQATHGDTAAGPD